jgi:leader peptidase (prepilin peptidase)/N-methyltransferase
MLTLISIFTFVFGTIIGSFLNVVILRFNTGRSVNGRSGCMKCGYQLKFYDLFPIFSYLFLRGKCRKCGSKISIQYPLVELLTGTLFLGLLLHFQPYFESIGLTAFLFFWNALIFSILIIIFVYDLRHKIIPNELSYAFAALTFLQVIITFPLGSEVKLINWLDLLAGPIMFFPFWALWFVSKGRWIGLGDGKLAIGIGWYLGFVYSISAIVLSFWIGAFFSIIFLLIDRLKSSHENITMKTEIPFAPFLILGILIEFFWRVDVLGLKLFFF